MKYLPLFELRLSHPYYSHGRCDDFLIEPARHTQQLLKNHRCLVKSGSNLIRVLSAVDGQDEPFIPLTAGATFTFQLRLKNSDFGLFTDLSELAGNPAPVYSNAPLAPANGGAQQLQLQRREAWHREHLSVNTPAADERFTLSGAPQPGLQAAEFRVLDSGSIKGIDHFDGGGKVVTVNSQSARAGEVFTVEYPIRPSLGRGVLADVDIEVNDSFGVIQQGPARFEIAFAAKQVRWVYYCVTQLENSDVDVQIQDAETAGTIAPLNFSDANRTDLHRADDPSDGVASTLAKQYPGLQRFRFVSDELVSCRQAPRKNIQLLVDGTPVPGPLPNPALRNVTRLDFNGAAGGEQDSLFQIVKHLPYSFSTSGE